MKEKSVRAIIYGPKFGRQRALDLRLAFDCVKKAIETDAQKIEVVFLVESNEERNSLKKELERIKIDSDRSFIVDELSYFTNRKIQGQK